MERRIGFVAALLALDAVAMASYSLDLRQKYVSGREVECVASGDGVECDGKVLHTMMVEGENDLIMWFDSDDPMEVWAGFEVHSLAQDVPCTDTFRLVPRWAMLSKASK